MEENQQLTKVAFSSVIHQIFPEIKKVQQFSREGKILIDDALTCLFNAFDVDRSGRISYKKMIEGLSTLCDIFKGGDGTMFERGSEMVDTYK